MGIDPEDRDMAIGSRATVQIRDHGTDTKDAELSAVSVPSYQIDAGNLPVWLTGWGDFKTALAAIIIGVQAKETVLIYNTVLSDAVPVSVWANRELKLRVSYTGDSLGEKFEVSIPCPNLEALTLLANDKVLLEDGDVMEAWVTAYEAIARSPHNDAETVTVTGAEIVGRNV